MKRRRSSVLVGLIAFLGLTLTPGCETGFVEDAALDSLASFVTSVFGTAVSATLQPE